MEQVFEQTFGSKEVILYGEGYGPKIQKNGELYGDDVSFILFDVKINGTYLDFANVIDIGESLGIDVVPILMEDDLISIIDFVAEGHKSTIGNNDMEGVVARPKYPLYDRRGNRIIVKVKYNDVKDCK